MAKAVLTTKISPDYDDLPEQRYHFPATYLNQIRAACGDWIVYYEPRRATGNLSSSGGRQAYFATAYLDAIVPDMSRPNHFYANVSKYLEFNRPVPFAEGQDYFESALQKDDGSTNKGKFGRSVRLLKEQEYELILAAGFAPILENNSTITPSTYSQPERTGFLAGFAEPEQPPLLAEEPAFESRAIVEQLVSRLFRDRSFSSMIKAAYGDTCAVTGLKIINGGGKSEVQAAHIRPVSSHGPDSVRNGIALSGTVHWMFDRGLLSIDDNYKLLVARDRVPGALDRLLPSNGQLRVPMRPEFRPHPQFLKFHRDTVFKG